jgi:hypothetical protein
MGVKHMSGIRGNYEKRGDIVFSGGTSIDISGSQFACTSRFAAEPAYISHHDGSGEHRDH